VYKRQALDQVLAPFGGQVAHDRSEQTSHAMLNNEVREQRVLGTLLPSIFLGVAAFLLHVVVARLVATQREQVAALKALGYTHASITAHYLKLITPIVAGGYALGLGLGVWLGTQVTRLYAVFFHFPSFEHDLPPSLVAISLLIVTATAALGTLTAVGTTVRMSPAAAMQPPAPGHYRRTPFEQLPWLGRQMGLRMILRNLERRPLRALLTTSAIAAAVAIVIMGNFLRDAIQSIVDVSFNLALRGDVVVWTTHNVSLAAQRELMALPGVRQVEAGRSVAVRFVNGQRAESGVLQGYAAVPELRRVIDLNKLQIRPGQHGILMTDRLAHKLGLKPGQWITLEVREGDRRVRRVLLERTVSDMMGLNAHMELGALNRLMGDDEVASIFSLAVDRLRISDVLLATQGMPAVAGAFSKASMLRNMQEISARNILVMSTILTAFAGVIAVGVVYNNARIALSERSWELASLRVLGFTRAEVSALLLGELALTLALALPLGMALGRAMTGLLVSLIRSDQFSFPVVILPRTYAGAALCVPVSYTTSDAADEAYDV
jgi:putative ABC transport system permease protein